MGVRSEFQSDLMDLTWKRSSYIGLLLDAIKFSGVRALLSAGWSKIGGSDVADNVFLLGGSPVCRVTTSNDSN